MPLQGEVHFRGSTMPYMFWFVVKRVESCASEVRRFARLLLSGLMLWWIFLIRQTTFWNKMLTYLYKNNISQTCCINREAGRPALTSRTNGLPALVCVCVCVCKSWDLAYLTYSHYFLRANMKRSGTESSGCEAISVYFWQMEHL